MTVDEIADRLGWPKHEDCLGQRVYVGTWLSGNRNPDYPPRARIVRFEDEWSVVDVNPAAANKIRAPQIVRLVLVDSGWVRSRSQPDSEIAALDRVLEAGDGIRIAMAWQKLRQARLPTGGNDEVSSDKPA